MDLRIAYAVRSISLGVWLGGIVMAFIVAQIVFQKLEPDRTKAGEIVGAILHTAGWVKAGLAFAALLAEVYLFSQWRNSAGSGWRHWLPGAFLLAAIACTLVTIGWLEPTILKLREQIGQFTAETANSPERIQFRKLHGMSMGLLSLEAVFVFLALLSAELKRSS